MATQIKHPARLVIGALLFALALVIGLAFTERAYADDGPTLASVALNTRIPAKGHTEPGSVHLVNTTDVPAALVGGTCTVEATGANNESVHPNSDILIASGESATVIADVEREAGASNIPGDSALTLGDSVTVSVRLGPDGLFSGGTLVVDFTCTPPPPPSTTTPTTAPPSFGCTAPDGSTFTTDVENSNVCTSTTTAPSVTTAPPKCVDNPATPNNECTLPHTGGTPRWPAAVGFAALLAGTILVAGWRRDATRTR